MLTVGLVFTVIVTVPVVLQLLASFTVTVYIWVVAGVATGEDTVEELKLADGVQL